MLLAKATHLFFSEAITEGTAGQGDGGLTVETRGNYPLPKENPGSSSPRGPRVTDSVNRVHLQWTPAPRTPRAAPSSEPTGTRVTAQCSQYRQRP